MNHRLPKWFMGITGLLSRKPVMPNAGPESHCPACFTSTPAPTVSDWLYAPDPGNQQWLRQWLSRCFSTISTKFLKAITKWQLDAV